VNRRTFLRVLGSAAVAVAAAPLLEQIPAFVVPTAASPYWDKGSVGVLTYETLERAYLDACIGSEMPNLTVVSASFARKFGLVYDVDLEDAA
jgi:hypothetical protein